jgi:hypothetical protein
MHNSAPTVHIPTLIARLVLENSKVKRKPQRDASSKLIMTSER